MILWALIFLFLFLFAFLSILFLTSRLLKFHQLHEFSQKHKWLARLVSLLIVILPIAACWVLLGYMNAIIIVLHLTVFWLVADLIQKLIQRIGKCTFSFYFAGVFALVFTCGYLAIGFYQDYHVWQTEYTISTTKDVGSLKVAMLADSHMGTTFNGQEFAEHVKTIQAQNPDLVVIVGDFIDEDTSKQDMIDACAALKNFDTPYGTYFVFGNHDKGTYSNGRRGYTGDDLIAELEKNGVTVLQDETVLIDNRFYLIGRQDASEERKDGGRATIAELTEGLDMSKFCIVLDHQPREYALEASAGTDLVLSGHTHGGQLWPLQLIENTFPIATDDRVYGYEQRENTNFIVTSGISDWAIKIKTGCRSEFVIINIE